MAKGYRGYYHLRASCLPPLVVRTNSGRSVDWFVLCCHRRSGRCISSGPQAQLTGYFRVLSRENVSAPGGPQCISPVYHIPSSQASCFLPPEIRHLGQLTLVLELGHQSYLCDAGDPASAVGSSIR